ncbi:MAG TPA: UDP-N-acetylglucosamine 1-carboxyvinyltransferase [Acidimicrobiales bacterium]|nr:UDP-N-acetylglucosamine 1-carboxyvinyltransferase [Acidimicrobiales bacterium]
MDHFLVRPSGPLRGEVTVQGAKNSALKLMAASLLAEGTTRLRNVPHITDVAIMADMLRALGASVERDAGGDLLVDAPADLVPVAPYELVERMRASIVVLGPLLARQGRARLSLPGGDDFGHRPIDFHLRAFGELGVEFTTEHGYVEGRCDRLVGARIVLEYPSHTTTDNVLMAAVLAKGTTLIENAAREPEIEDLASLLRSMGARIEGDGTSRIEVEGVDELHPGDHVTVPDRVEAATFLTATALAGGEVHVRGARHEHMDMLLDKLAATGMEPEVTATGILARAAGRPAPVDVATLPYPGVATDYKPLLVTLLSVASGVSIVSENLFAGRFRYVDGLCRMGADIRTEGHHAVIRGVERLSGARVRAPDIRGGAALVLAGLVADGETTVAGARHVERGYEDFAGKLRRLGADVTRIDDRPAG